MWLPCGLANRPNIETNGFIRNITSNNMCVMRVTLFVCYVFLFLVFSLRRFELFFALRFGIETVVVEVLVVCFISIKIIESIFVL